MQKSIFGLKKNRKTWELGLLFLKASKKIITSNLQIYTEIGYKNDGFIEGEILRNGMLFKIGLKL